MELKRQIEALEKSMSHATDFNLIPRMQMVEWHAQIKKMSKQMEAAEPVAWRAYWSSALNDAYFRQEDRLSTLKAYIEENAIFVDRITPVYEAPPNTYTAEQVQGLVEALREAKRGLVWYQEICPELVNGSDSEAMERIDGALAKPKEQSE